MALQAINKQHPRQLINGPNTNIMYFQKKTGHCGGRGGKEWLASSHWCLDVCSPLHIFFICNILSSISSFTVQTSRCVGAAILVEWLSSGQFFCDVSAILNTSLKYFLLVNGEDLGCGNQSINQCAAGPKGYSPVGVPTNQALWLMRIIGCRCVTKGHQEWSLDLEKTISWM